MKIKLLSILSFFYFSSAVSQNYIPLLNDINEWKVTSCDFGCITDTYYTDDDTIVNGYNHKILDGFHYISRSFLLREDLIEKKVYLTYISPSSTIIEYLLYDFSLQVGDSMELKNPLSPFPSKAGNFKVDSIVSRPLFNGNNHNYFYLSPTANNPFSQDPCIWVEGIGSLSLINAPGGKPDINYAGHLSCFFVDTQLVYSKLDSIQICEASYIQDTTTSISNLTFHLQINLKGRTLLIQNAKAIKQVHLLNLNGENVENLTNKKQEEIVLDLTSLSSGIYFLTVENQAFQQTTYKILLD